MKLTHKTTAVVFGGPLITLGTTVSICGAGAAWVGAQALHGGNAMTNLGRKVWDRHMIIARAAKAKSRQLLLRSEQDLLKARIDELSSEKESLEKQLAASKQIAASREEIPPTWAEREAPAPPKDTETETSAPYVPKGMSPA